ncbi:hypothetical protein HN51_053353 [Arachis hypogaea]
MVKSSPCKDPELRCLLLLICGRFRLLPRCALLYDDLLLRRRAPPRDAHPRASSIDGFLPVPGLLPRATHNRPLLPRLPLSPLPCRTPSVSGSFACKLLKKFG